MFSNYFFFYLAWVTFIYIFPKVIKPISPTAYSTIMVKQGPRPLVICGPSGSGKSTLLKKLRKELPDTFALCVSHTTRKPRPGETDGIEYHFVTIEEMQAAIERGEFLETATFSGNMYGTRYIIFVSLHFVFFCQTLNYFFNF